MRALADWCLRHRRIVVAGWGLLLVVLLAVSQRVGADYRFSTEFPGSESIEAVKVLEDGMPAAAGDTVSIAWQTPTEGAVRSPLVQQRISSMLTTVAGLPGVASVASPYTGSPAAAAQISSDGSVAFAIVTLDGKDLPAEQVRAVVDTARAASDPAVVSVAVGGQAVRQANPPHPGAAEFIGLAAAALILLLAFGSVLSMLLPIAAALIALGSAIATVTFLTHVIDIPNFAPQLTALIGLGVGIDYALFVVTRHRTNLKRGLDVPTSIVRAMDTSGRAVVFAAITVVIALCGLLVTGVGFLYGMALSAAVGVLWTMLVTVTLLPALLGFLGNRVLSRRERRRLDMHGAEDEEPSGGWMRVARGVQRRPVLFAVAAVAILLTLAAPAASLRLGSADAGNDAAGTTTRAHYDMLTDGFGAGFTGPLLVVARTPAPADVQAVQAAAERVATTGGVAAVSPVRPAPDGASAMFTVYPTTAPRSKETSDLIATLRNQVLPAAAGPDGPRFLVGGATAVFDDFAANLQGKLPVFLLVAVGLSCLLLLLAFRSVVIPLKAAVMNLLAAAASFGVLVAVFQNGVLGEWIGLDRTGPVDAFLPIMLLAILFGLSMDYQVFLVSRMHEEWVLTGDNRTAVIRGLGETGRVITAAALIMVSVFVSFIFGDDRIIKMFGVGLAVAIFLDAFVIRSLLVPAAMVMIGRWNWWMPAWLERVLPRLTIEPSDFAEQESADTGHRPAQAAAGQAGGERA